MKKSELVKHIFDYLEQNTLLHPKISYKVAKGLVKLVEEVGLKPPLTKRCPVLLTTIHVWEPENES